MRQHCCNKCCSWKAVYNTIKKVLHGTQVKFIDVLEKDPSKPEQIDPEVSWAPIYVGNLPVMSPSIITGADIKSYLNELEYGTYQRYKIDAQQFSFVTIAVPHGLKVCYMEDLAGGKAEFYTDATDVFGKPWYCNGEVQVDVDGLTYDIYGMYTAASGELYIYIE